MKREESLRCSDLAVLLVLVAIGCADRPAASTAVVARNEGIKYDRTVVAEAQRIFDAQCADSAPIWQREVNAADGISRCEANTIADAFFRAHPMGCGGSGAPIDQGNHWTVPIWEGALGTPAAPLHIDKQSGRVSRASHFENGGYAPIDQELAVLMRARAESTHPEPPFKLSGGVSPVENAPDGGGETRAPADEVAPTDPTPTTTVNVRDRSLRFPSDSPCLDVFDGRRDTGFRSISRLKGLSRSALLECFGEPDSVEGPALHYRFIDGGDCYWATELTVTLHGDKVSGARRRRVVTGMHCEY